MDHTRNYLAPSYTTVSFGNASVIHYCFHATGSSVYKVTEDWRGRLVHWGWNVSRLNIFLFATASRLLL